MPALTRDAGPSQARGGRPGLWLFIACALTLLLLSPGKSGGSDTTEMMRLAEGISRGTIAVDPPVPGWSIAGRDGRYYSRYGLTFPTLMAPVCWTALRAAEIAPRYPARYYTGFAISLLNPLIVAAGCALLFALLRDLGFSGRRAAALALVYGFATGLFPASKVGMSEPLSATLLLAAYLAARRAGTRDSLRYAALAGVAAAAAFLNRPMMLAAVPGLAIALVASGRERLPARRVVALLMVAGVLLAIGLGVQLWYDWARFGDVRSTGYDKAGDGFGATPLDLAARAAALLVSPKVGLLPSYPFLLLAILGVAVLRRRAGGDALACVAIIGAFIAFIACYQFWTSGYRYLLPPLVFFFPLVAAGLDHDLIRSRPGRMLAIATFAAALALVAPLVLVSTQRGDMRQVVDGIDPQDVWRIDLVPGLDAWRDVAHVARVPADAPLVYSENSLPVGDQATWLERSATLNSYAFWFVHARRLGVSLLAILSIVAVLAAGAVFAFISLSRAVRPEAPQP